MSTYNKTYSGLIVWGFEMSNTPYSQSFPATFNMESGVKTTAGFLIDDAKYCAANGTNCKGSFGSLTIFIEKFEDNMFTGTFEFEALKVINDKPIKNIKLVIREGKFTNIPAL